MAGMYPDNQTISLFGEEVSWPGLDPETGKFTNGDFSNPMKKPSFIPAETINLILDNLAGLIASLGGSPGNSGADQLKDALAAALALKADNVGGDVNRVKNADSADKLAAARNITIGHTALPFRGDADIDFGNIGFRFRGAWVSSGQSWEVNDVVTSNDQTFVCTARNAGAVTPEDSITHSDPVIRALWALLPARASNADLLRAYPPGTIYESVLNVSPAEFLGGTWTVWGSGRVPVGVNTADGNFNTVEREGGASAHTLTAAQMPSHTHSQNQHTHGIAFALNRGGGGETK